MFLGPEARYIVPRSTERFFMLFRISSFGNQGVCLTIRPCVLCAYFFFSGELLLFADCGSGLFSLGSYGKWLMDRYWGFAVLSLFSACFDNFFWIYMFFLILLLLCKCLMYRKTFFISIVSRIITNSRISKVFTRTISC